MAAAQLEAIEKAAAAICRAHGWSQRSVIGHLEWQPGKVDPRGFTMASMRARIKARLGGKPYGPGRAAPDPAAAADEPFPAPRSSAPGRHSPIITAMGKRLVAEGCGRYEVGPSPDWSEADQNSYAAWQRKLGFSGSDADGIPGKSSWDRLKVPNV